MHARSSILATLLGLALLAPAAAQELRTNADGSPFTVHVDPRARPTMSVEELIALSDQAERASGGVRATIVRIDLLSGADLLRWFPQVAPLQSPERWFWVVWLDGDFSRNDGPGGRERRGRLGWAVYDDGNRSFVSGGFHFDSDTLPSAQPQSSL